MSSSDEVSTVHENDPARKAVILTANNKFVTVPVVNDEVCRNRCLKLLMIMFKWLAYSIYHTLSSFLPSLTNVMLLLLLNYLVVFGYIYSIHVYELKFTLAGVH